MKGCNNVSQNRFELGDFVCMLDKHGRKSLNVFYISGVLSARVNESYVINDFVYEVSTLFGNVRYRDLNEKDLCAINAEEAQSFFERGKKHEEENFNRWCAYLQKQLTLQRIKEADAPVA